jgi:hypothetical protein
MPARTHQLTSVGVGLALNEQFGNASLQYIRVGAPASSILGQVGNLILHAFGKGDLHPVCQLGHIALARVDA